MTDDQRTIQWMREEAMKVVDEIQEWQDEKDITKATYDRLQEIKRDIAEIGTDAQYD